MLIKLICYLILSLTVMATAEYSIHRWMMHRQFFRNKLRWVFEHHAIEHHKNERNDINIDLPVRIHLVAGLPLLIGFFLIDPWLCATQFLVFLYHSAFWTAVHRMIHGLETNWARFHPGYSWYVDHHLKHHKNPTKNFGVVFPWIDYIFGTKI